MAVESNFKAIEGLRGYLALWVAIGHAFQMAGYFDLPGPFKIVMKGAVAVEIFMIVSGFVITHLLTTKEESYGRYVVRRFFRLYPCFVLCCLIGYLIIPLMSDFVQSRDWSGPAWTPYVDSIVQLEDQQRDNFWAHLGLHAVMLHGLVPGEVLPRAPMTFLPAAWSISLEWQFYLVAPLVLAMIRTPARAAVLIVVCMGLFASYRLGVFGSFEVASHLAGNIGPFAVGIASRLALPHLRKVSANALTPAMFAGAAALVLLYKEALTLLLWLPFYCFLVWGQGRGLSGKAFDLLFSSKAVVWAGTISFSVYLLHRPVQVLAVTLVERLAGVLSQPETLAVQFVATALTLPLGWLTYRFVEKPGMALGRRVVALAPFKAAPATA